MSLFFLKTDFLYLLYLYSSTAYIQDNDDSVDLHHTPLTCKWSKSVGCLFTCFSVIIHHYSKNALTVIWCQIGLIFTSKGYVLCRCKWSDNIVWRIITVMSFSPLWSNLALSAVWCTDASISLHNQKMKTIHNCCSKCTQAVFHVILDSGMSKESNKLQDECR